MVWFQCEDCGENLKKPKLPNHFRACSANKFSCIDCGVIFGQQSVQSHTQCVTEAEKYGPKGEGKASSVLATMAKNDAKQKQKPDVDVNVGLSERPPWFCSLCNTKATSKQTLLLHADGKKHRAKARAHAAKQQPKSEASTPDANIANGDAQKCELPSNPDVKETKEEDPPKAAAVQKGSEAENLNLSLKKKRKNSEVEIDGALKKCVAHPSGGLGNGEASHIENAEAEETVCQVKKAKHNVPKEREGVESSSEKKDSRKKIKWKKLITSALKSNPDRVVKMKKLRKLVLKALQESGINEDKSHFGELLEHKINSSSRFTVVDKNVHLVAKN